MLCRKYILGFVCVAVLVVVSAAPAYAVRILPPRIVMKSNESVAYVYVNNNSAKAETYRFGWLDVAMTKDGQVINLTNNPNESVPAYRSAQDYIRFSPRQTTIQPGQTQRIALFARRTPEMVDGEYRSHFLVQRMPDPVLDDTNKQGDADGTKVGVNFLVSRSFPVYMYNGDVGGELSLDSARLTWGEKGSGANGTTPYYVELSMSKTGNRSILGNIEVLCGDAPIHVSNKVFSLYAEADASKELVLLDQPKAKACSAPHVRVTGHPDDIAAGKVWGDLPVSR